MIARAQRQGAESYAARTIERKTEKLVGRFGLTESDVEDMRQDLQVAVCEAMPNYDPEKGSPTTFIACVVSRRICNIVRDRVALARSSESSGLSEGGEAERSVPGCERSIDMAMDVAETVSRLPAELREICRRLRVNSSAEVARSMGLSRPALYRKMCQIRRLFGAAGLRDYLG